MRTPNAIPLCFLGARAVLWSALLTACAALPAAAGSFAEPATVFYGKVLAAGSATPFLVTTGELAWTIRRADGAAVTLRTRLFPLNQGEYSYRLNVPHEALALGLSPSSGSVPVAAAEQTQEHLQIQINGQTARLLGPSGAAFFAAQGRRAATYRLDLAVPLAAEDADGDGVPDWWERQHGADDPLADPDADGLRNAAEFRRGSDPTRDDRTPSVLSREIRAFAEGTSILPLRSVDADSEAAELRYTLTRTPENGVIRLRNSSSSQTEPDRSLTVGDTFTQAEVNQGRVIFVHHHTDETDTSATFEISLRDEDPAHSPAVQTIRLQLYRPNPALSEPELQRTRENLPRSIAALPNRSPDEQALLAGYLLSREMNHIICDASTATGDGAVQVPSSGLTPAQYQASYVPNFGPDRPHVLLGGLGRDRLAGGMEADLLVGSAGDDSLRGNGGADCFLFLSQADGNDTIEDFSLDEDVLDISRVLTGTSLELTSYLQVATVGTNSLLRINSSGTGPAFTNLTITLAGVQMSPADLYNLMENGRLLTGDKSLPPRLSITATKPVAREEGPVAGEFTISRSGSVQSSLSVNLQVTGSALNGVDYEYVHAPIILPEGARIATVRIVPYVDTLTELAEVVNATLLAGTGYSLGVTTAQVTIEDLAPRLSIEALEPVAEKNSLTPALFLVSRGGVLDRSVLVRLQIGGTAVNGVDYERIPSYLNFTPGQTTQLLPITPLAASELAGGPKSVLLSIKPDAAYNLETQASARVILVEERLTFGGWRQQHFATSDVSLAAFANEDPGNYGLPNLLRYAFGLDPAKPDRARLPRPVLRNGYLTLDVWQRPEAVDLDYEVEVSSDLVHWQNSPATVEIIPAENAASDPSVICYRALPATSEGQKLFMRIRVVHKP